jgi:hypothetical protein
MAGTEQLRAQPGKTRRMAEDAGPQLGPLL